MSKVLKSSAINIQSPLIIDIMNEEETSSLYGDDVSIEDDENKETDTAADINLVRQQTDEILKETEQMVKDLLETARIEAEKKITEAKQEAEKIVQTGKENLRQIEEEGFNQGFGSGYAEGQKKAEEDYRSKLEEARNIVELAHEERKNILINSENEIVELAMAIARKIIGNEILSNPDFVVEVAKRAIQKAADREDITIRVSPENLDSALGAKDNIFQSVNGIRNLKIVSDPTIEPGGCVVDTPNGTVDARIERQLSEIEQSLTEVGPDA